MKSLFLASSVVLISAITGCGSDDGGGPFVVKWDAATCAPAGIETVRVTATPSAGDKKTAESACSAGQVDMGVLPAGRTSILGEGLDASGAVVAANAGDSIEIVDAAPMSHEIEITLKPKDANVIVKWQKSGGPCPSGVILPYFLSLYRPPANSGSQPTDKVSSVSDVQVSCSAGTGTLQHVPPGDYVVLLDSRATSPKVTATARVTVKAGQDANVTIDL